MISDSAARPPGPAEVVVRVAGVALGCEPAAEIAGVVESAGDAAGDWLARRVVVPRVLPCGECDRCRRGRAATCLQRAERHGLATYETVAARPLCSVEPPLWPAGIELWQLAALPDAAATPYGGLVRAGLAPGELLVVLGGGVRGAFAVAIARALGAHPVLVDSHAPSCERALSLGARFVVDADRSPGDARAEIERQAAALGVATHCYKLIETTATPAGRHRAAAMLPDGGTAVLLDGGDDLLHPLPAMPWESLARSEAQLIGASACHPDLFPELCALVVRGELPIARLVTRVSPADAAEALALRRQGRLLELPIIVP